MYIYVNVESYDSHMISSIIRQIAVDLTICHMIPSTLIHQIHTTVSKRKSCTTFYTTVKVLHIKVYDNTQYHVLAIVNVTQCKNH